MGGKKKSNFLNKLKICTKLLLGLAIIPTGMEVDLALWYIGPDYIQRHGRRESALSW